MLAISVFGITKLTAENQFIKAFKEDTEIIQGLTVIDSELEAQHPSISLLKLIPISSLIMMMSKCLKMISSMRCSLRKGKIMNMTLVETVTGITHIAWKTIVSVHDYILESLNEAGKVISFDTTMDVLETLNDGDEIDTFFLSVLYKKVPDDVKEALFDPYLSEDGNQLRISFRVYESYPDLQRGELLKNLKET